MSDQNMTLDVGWCDVDFCNVVDRYQEGLMNDTEKEKFLSVLAKRTAESLT